jgi:cytochrome oxidase Cu insertion factor (SCO1/SenC/PrrC family)
LVFGTSLACGLLDGGPTMSDDLRALLQTLDTKVRDDLRRVLIRDQADRDAISSRLMRYRDKNGQDWADIIDFLTMWPDAGRQVVRLLGEIEAHPGAG